MTRLSVLHQAEGYLVVEKPAGLLVIPGRSDASGPCARELLEAQLGQGVFVVHRLDRDTSGLLLFALHARAHRTLSMAFEAGKVGKRYFALVKGRLESPLEIDAPLVPARRGRMRPGRLDEGAKAALTRVTPQELFTAHTLVEAQPMTGRTHQIRVHLASVGHPLCVDPQYGQPRTAGAPELRLERTPLHAASLTLPELEGIAHATFHSPLPADMACALALLRRVPTPLS